LLTSKSKKKNKRLKKYI